MLLSLELLVHHPICLIMPHNCFYSLFHLFFKQMRLVFKPAQRFLHKLISRSADPFSLWYNFSNKILFLCCSGSHYQVLTVSDLDYYKQMLRHILYSWNISIEINTTFYFIYTIVSFISTYWDFLQPGFGFTGYLSLALGSCCFIDDCFLFETGGLAATDSQLHKLFHPWSLVSLGTYTLLFRLILLGAAITPVASGCFCFSLSAYCMV